jgi:peptidoglycan endopeptidase LytE
VRAGDYLSGIAARHDISLAALLRANGISADTVIHPGQQLTLPAGASGTPATGGGGGGGGQRYTVRAGDSFSAIAARHNVTLGALLEANRLPITTIIHPGQTLVLPAGAAPAAPDPNTPAGRIAAVVNYARAQVGKGYKFFTHGPFTFDCSGLTLSAYAQAGITLVHHSGTQARQGTAVDFWNDPIRAGDLVFLKTRGSTKINHVGIAVSSTTWVQSRSPEQGVQIGPLPRKGIIVAVRRFITG